MKNLILLFVFIGIMSQANTQTTTVTYKGSFSEIKPKANNEFVMGFYRYQNGTSQGYQDGYAYILDSNYTMLDSVNVPNYNYDGVPSPPTSGTSSYLYGSYIEHVTYNEHLFVNGITWSNLGDITGAVYYRSKNGTLKNLVPYYNVGIGKIIDKGGKVYVSCGIPTLSTSKLGTGKKGLGGTSAIQPQAGVYTTAIIIADTLADSSSTTAHKEYVIYRDSNYSISDMKLMKNGNFMIRSYNQTLDKTRYFILDGTSPKIGTSTNPNFISDTIVNGFSWLIDLPNGNFALYDNKDAYNGKITILDSAFNVIKNGFQYAGRISYTQQDRGLYIVDNHIEYLRSSFSVSFNGVPIEIHRGHHGGYHIQTKSGVFYTHGFTRDSVLLTKTTDYLPDSTLKLTVNDTDPNILGAYNYVDRYKGTDSLVDSDENIAYLKFATASTYTSVGVGNALPLSWASVPTNQQYGGGRLEYDSLDNYYYTYYETIKSSVTWTTYRHRKFLKVILTTDNVDTANAPTLNTPPQFVIRQWSVAFDRGVKMADTVHYFDVDGDPCTLSVTGLPNDLGLSDSIVSGTPLVVGNYTAKFVLTDGKDTVRQTMSIYIQSPVSVKENEVLTISVYPNPTTDFLMIDSDVQISYMVYDQRGSLMKLGKGKKISLLDVPRGAYTLVVQTKNGITRKTIIKN